MNVVFVFIFFIFSYKPVVGKKEVIEISESYEIDRENALGLSGNENVFPVIRCTFSNKNESMVVKLADQGNNEKRNYQLFQKRDIYPLVPRVFVLGVCNGKDAIVMDFIGPSLAEVFESKQMKTYHLAMLAIKALDALISVHSTGLTMKTVNAHKFVYDTHNGTVYVVGFGNASETLEPRPEPLYKTQMVLLKDPVKRYRIPRCELESRKQQPRSQDDDIEQLILMIINVYEEAHKNTKPDARTIVFWWTILPDALINALDYIRKLNYEGKVEHAEVRKFLTDLKKEEDKANVVKTELTWIETDEQSVKRKRADSVKNVNGVPSDGKRQKPNQ